MDEAHDHSVHTQGLSLPVMLALGGAAIVAGIVLVPYVAPAIGLGNINIAEEALLDMHNMPLGDGLARGLNQVISGLPFIGEELAKGGFTNIIITAATGMGGVLLGDWVSRNRKDKDGIDWGHVIKWGALATSALIALPSILTGVSNGIIYMVNELAMNGALDPQTGSNIVKGTLNTIGIIPYQEPMDLGLTGVAVTLPHLLTCGLSMFPLAASVGAHKVLSNKDQEKDNGFSQKIRQEKDLGDACCAR